MIQVWVDGSTRPSNPGPGGSAWCVKYAGKRYSGSAGYTWTTNNRMELTAAIEGLIEAQRLARKKNLRSPDIRVFSDSAYVVNAFNKSWVGKWQRDNFHRADGEPVKNADLWRKLIALDEQLYVTWEHVPGHSGNADNEWVDTLAGEAAKRPDRADEGYMEGD